MRLNEGPILLISFTEHPYRTPKEERGMMSVSYTHLDVYKRQVSTYEPNGMKANPDLKWETTTSRNIGFDFGSVSYTHLRIDIEFGRFGSVITFESNRFISATYIAVSYTHLYYYAGIL